MQNEIELRISAANRGYFALEVYRIDKNDLEDYFGTGEWTQISRTNQNYTRIKVFSPRER